MPLIGIPTYRQRVLTGPVAVRARAVLRQLAGAPERELMTGQVASAQVQLFLHYQPPQAIRKIVPCLKGLSSRVRVPAVAPLRKPCWGRHLWARGDRAVSAGNRTAELSQRDLEEQDGQPRSAESRFTIDSCLTPRLTGEGSPQ